MSPGKASRSARPARLASLVGCLLACLALASPARAAGPCGGTVTVAPGDTLAGIARRCASSVAALLQANPQIDDPRGLQLGWQLKLHPAGPPGSAEAQPAAPPESAATATVSSRPANRDGLTRDGYQPTARGVQSLAVWPRSGAVGTAVTVNATGLPPGPVEIGAGLPGADWQQLARVEVAGDGGLVQEVAIPDWSGGGDLLVFTIRAAGGTTLTSGSFQVTGPPSDIAGRRPLPEDGLLVSGRIRQDEDCILLETAHGHLYGLSSESWTFTPGARVALTGRPATQPPCGEARGAIEVVALRAEPAAQAQPSAGNGN